MKRYIGTGLGLALLVVVGSSYAFLDDDIPVSVKPKPAKRPVDESRSKPRIQSGQAEGARQEAARSPQWADSDNGADTHWEDATAYCAGKGKGWRLPTVAELQSSYQSGHSTPCGQWTCKISSSSHLTGPNFWSNEPNGSTEAWYVSLDYGGRITGRMGLRGDRRALCIRRP